MKHISIKEYTDTVLNRHVEKGSILEDEYHKDSIELTEERTNYLVNVRNLYTTIEDSNKKNKKITKEDDSKTKKVNNKKTK